MFPILFPALLASSGPVAQAAPTFPLVLDVEYCFEACSDYATFQYTLNADGTFETRNPSGARFEGVWSRSPGTGGIELVYDMSAFGIELVYRGAREGRCLEGEIWQTSLSTGVVTEGSWRGCPR